MPISTFVSHEQQKYPYLQPFCKVKCVKVSVKFSPVPDKLCICYNCYFFIMRDILSLSSLSTFLLMRKLKGICPIALFSKWWGHKKNGLRCLDPSQGTKKYDLSWLVWIQSWTFSPLSTITFPLGPPSWLWSTQTPVLLFLCVFFFQV